MENLTSIKGTWRAVSFEDYDAGSVTYKTAENSWDKEIVITFDDRQDLMEYHGTNTTNRISDGAFSYSTNKSILVSGYATTYINQPDWGRKFTEIFVSNLDLPYKLNKKYLRIYKPELTKSVTLKKE